MRLLPLFFVGSAIGIATAAAMSPAHQHAAPTLTVQHVAPVSDAPMDADDGALPAAKDERDALNDHEAEGRVLVLCSLISADDYQANAEADAARRTRTGEATPRNLAEDRAYIAGMQSVLNRHSCNEIAQKPWARAWRPLER